MQCNTLVHTYKLESIYKLMHGDPLHAACASTDHMVAILMVQLEL